MTNIVDFLLSRIAEDESGVRNGSAYWEGCYGDECHDRMLAECAAKRAIIKQADEADSETEYAISQSCINERERDEARATAPGKLIREALAAVYASHPDYRQEWSVA